MKLENLKPEVLFSINHNMTIEKLLRAQKSNKFIVAKVLSYISSTKSLIVDLGNNFTGEIPIEEFSIYPVLDSNGEPTANVYMYIKKIICACVTSVDVYSKKVTLSRKKNMLRAFKCIEQDGLKQIFTCCVTSTNQRYLFVDVGFGLYGAINNANLLATNVKDISADCDFIKIRQIIHAIVLGVNTDNYHIELNYRLMFSNKVGYLQPGTLVYAIVRSPLNEENEDKEEKNSYFAQIARNTPALMDSKKGVKLPYGTEVLACVKPSKRPGKVRLEFYCFWYPNTHHYYISFFHNENTCNNNHFSFIHD